MWLTWISLSLDFSGFGQYHFVSSNGLLKKRALLLHYTIHSHFHCLLHNRGIFATHYHYGTVQSAYICCARFAIGFYYKRNAFRVSLVHNMLANLLHYNTCFIAFVMLTCIEFMLETKDHMLRLFYMPIVKQRRKQRKGG